MPVDNSGAQAASLAACLFVLVAFGDLRNESGRWIVINSAQCLPIKLAKAGAIHAEVDTCCYC